jgi:hypothetical protein
VWWLVALVLVAFAAWSAVEMAITADAAKQAQGSVKQALTSLRDNDLGAARAELTTAGEQTGRARRAAGSLPLRVIAAIPIFGRDVHAGQVATASIDDIVNDAALPLLDAGQVIIAAQEKAAPGSFAVAAVRAEQGHITSAAEVAARANADLAEINPDSLVFFADQFAEIQSQVDDVARGCDAAARAARLLPTALGLDESKSYLLVFQNLAEERATGGIMGSWAVVKVENGVLTLTDAGVNDVFDGLTSTWQSTPDDVRELYGADLAEHQNVNLSPDFPTGAQLMSGLWQQHSGRAADGIISVTPVALAGALKVTGPVQVPGGPPLTAKNAVDVLQAQVYATFTDNNARGAYLGLVTGAVFAKVLEEGVSTPKMWREFATLAQDGQVLAWFADPRLQDLVADMPVGGALRSPEDGYIGLYLTNIDASKLGQYTHLSLASGCASGSPRVSAAVRYDPPAKVVPYVRGTAGRDPELSHIVTVSYYIPPTRGVTEATVNGEPVSFKVGVERGWTVVRFDVQFNPGTTTELGLQLSGSSSVPALVTQPLTNPVTLEQDEVSSTCS